METLRTHKTGAVLAALALAVLGAAAAGLCLGSQPYTPAQLWRALCARDAADTVWRVVAYVRLPRVLAGLFAGAALAAAGVLLQAVLNNAMASPNVIGVNAGAGFFALLAMALAPAVPGRRSSPRFWARWAAPCSSTCWPGGQGFRARRWCWRAWRSAACSRPVSTRLNCSGRSLRLPRPGS